MAFLDDSLTDANGTLLSAHVGELNAAWTKHPNAGSGTFDIRANRTRPVGTGLPQLYYASGVPASADYDVDGVISLLTDTGTGPAIMGRLATNDDTGYGVRWISAATDIIQLFKVVAGAITQLQTFNFPFAAGDVAVKLEMRGTAIKVYVNGVERISVVDNAIAAAGRVGVRAAGAMGTATGSHIASISASDPAVDVTGDVASALPALIQDATGAATASGDAQSTAPALAQDASGEVVTAGDAASALPALAQDGAGTFGPVGGAGVSDLPGLAQDCAGTVGPVVGEGATALPALAQDGTAAASTEGDATQVLPALSQDAAGAVEGVPVAGEAASNLPALAQDGAADVRADGDVAQALPALGQDANGVLRAEGEAEALLPGLGQEASGAVDESVSGTMASVLATVGVVATGELSIAGDGASVLPALVHDAEGDVQGPRAPGWVVLTTASAYRLETDARA